MTVSKQVGLSVIE